MKATRALPGSPAVLWLVAFLLAPLALVLFTSVSPTNVLPGRRTGGAADASAAMATAPFPFTLHHFERALSEPFVSVLWSSLALSAGATLLCLVSAFPVAWFLARRPASSRGLWLALFLTPFLLNFLVRVYAWFILLRPEGLLSRLATAVGYDGALTSSRATVVLGLVYGYLPFFLLPLYAVLEKIDARQLEAARDLGAGAWAQFRHVVLPHARPGKSPTTPRAVTSFPTCSALPESRTMQRKSPIRPAAGKRSSLRKRSRPWASAFPSSTTRARSSVRP